MKPLLAPSLLSADFSRLGEEALQVENAGADWLHIDIMDGHFVPNLTIGPLVVEALRPRTKLPLDCHLMVENPEKWIGPFSHAGAKLITIHIEATKDPTSLLKDIRSKGCKAGLSLNPDTPVQKVVPFLDSVDLVLIMSVFPGFGGQKFIEGTFDKIRELSAIRNSRPFLIEVDGGVSASNIRQLRGAGTDVFVAGSAVFSAPDRNKSIQALRAALGK